MTPTKRKKKKVDYQALNSPFMRIPRMSIETARLLLDLDIREIFELQGRSPEVLLEEHRKKIPDSPIAHLKYLKLAVYYAESEQPDPAKLHPDVWNDA